MAAGTSDVRADTIVPIHGVAVGGDGVGREASGRVVFAPRSAPGDVVRVELLEVKRRWARGRVREILEPGPGRRSAPCPRYDVCGGCQLQHLRRGEQLGARRSVVQETLRRIGGLTITVAEPIARGGELGYRNRVTFATSGGGSRFVAGFRGFEAPDRIVDVRLCPLAEAPISRAWEALREAWDSEEDAAPPPGTRITVRCSVLGEVDILTRGDVAPSQDSAARWVGSVPGLVGWHHATQEGDPVCLAGARTLADQWQGTKFELPADVFLQVNREVSSAMDDWLDSRVGSLGGRRVLDLYAGVGARAIRWAREGAEVVACEVAARATETCGRAAGPVSGSLEVLTDRVENRLAELLPADLIVVNPPRGGLSRKVSELLASASCEALAYVSCDPATLARDLARLKAGWNVVEVQPFDAFPQTAHVESVAWLRRA